jgi:hypothetical protein
MAVSISRARCHRRPCHEPTKEASWSRRTGPLFWEVCVSKSGEDEGCFIGECSGFFHTSVDCLIGQANVWLVEPVWFDA